MAVSLRDGWFPPPNAMIARSRSPVATLLLLVAGAGLWAVVTRCYGGPADALCLVPIAIAVALGRAMWRRRRRAAAHPSLRGRSRGVAWRAAIAGAIALGYFLLTAVYPGRDLFPKYHDEFVFLIQARMLLRGRLWMPGIAAAIAPFFDSHYLILRPVYAAQYWPGEALLLAAGLAMHLPPFLLAAIVSGGVVGLFYWIVARLIGERFSALAALMLVAVGPFRHQSVSISAFGSVMLAGLLMVVAWLNWRRGGGVGWAILFGAAGGWGAITRPVDALCYAVPLCAAAMFDAWHGRPRVAGRRRVAGLAVAMLAAMPLVALQLVFDRGVTGDWLEPPFVAYARRDFPQVEFGFPRYDPAIRPQSPLPQKQILYQQWAVPYVIAHQWPNVLRDTFLTRLPLTLLSPAPHPLLLVLLPVGLLGLRRRIGGRGLMRWALWLSLPLFFGLYACYTFFLPQYAMIVAPALILSMLMGFEAIGRAWPGMIARVLLPAAAAGLAIATLPQLTHAPEDPNRPRNVMAAGRLANYIHEPAVVLFRFDPKASSVHDEPVYNAEVADPDDAYIIRAHDLGPAADAAIFRYYAQHQPWREFYQFDERDGMLRPLGTAAELGAAASGATSPRLSP